MKRLVIPVLIVMALFVAGCDRFAHTFLPPDVIDFQAELFTPLDDALQSQPEAGIDSVMVFYAEDYLHFGLNKADRRTWLEGLYQGHPNAVAGATMLDSDQLSDSTAVANWRLTITDTKGVIVDSTFTGERLAKRDGRWLLRGNQMSCVLPTPKQHVIIEYFTFLTCPNCPVVEDKLHSLYLANPGQLSYLEYHVNDQLALPGDQTHAYYNYPSFPGSVIQGETLLTTSDPSILDEYDTLVAGLLLEDSEFRYTNPVFGIEGQSVIGTLNLELLAPEFDFADLVLNYILIERESNYTNVSGHKVKNVVRAVGRKNLSQTDLNAPITFVLESTVSIPDDASMVVFAQTRPPSFANNATIHSGIEVQLDR